MKRGSDGKVSKWKSILSSGWTLRREEK